MERPAPNEAERISHIIGIDIDEVLAAHFKHVVVSFNAEFGTSFTLEDIEYRYFLDDVASRLRGQEGLEITRRFYSDERFYFTGVEPLRGSQEMVNKLFIEGHSIHFITSRDPHLRPGTIQWLQENGFPVTDDNFHLREDIEEDSIEFKLRKAQELNLNLFIDDDSRIIEKLGIGSILVDYRWNRQTSGPHILRVTDWEQIYLHIQDLAKGEFPPKKN